MQTVFPDIATEMSVWDGVVVSPLERAYERPPPDQRREGEEEGHEGEAAVEEEMAGEHGEGDG